MACATIAFSPIQEGPHSVLNEEEFFDALEIAYHEDEKDPVSKIMFYYKLRLLLICVYSSDSERTAFKRGK